MKKFKRRLSLTLRGSQTIDESLSELAEQMTIEESSSKDNGKSLQGRAFVTLQTHFHLLSGKLTMLFLFIHVFGFLDSSQLGMATSPRSTFMF